MDLTSKNKVPCSEALNVLYTNFVTTSKAYFLLKT